MRRAKLGAAEEAARAALPPELVEVQRRPGAVARAALRREPRHAGPARLQVAAQRQREQQVSAARALEVQAGPSRR